MTVRARMKCNFVSRSIYQDYKTQSDVPSDSRKVVLNAVYSNDPNDPNYSFSQATPSGELTLWISNPSAVDYFKQGETYDVDFSKVG